MPCPYLFDTFSSINSDYFQFWWHSIHKLFSTEGRSWYTSPCPNAAMIQTSPIALYLRHSLPPPAPYTGLRFSTTELPDTGHYLLFLLQIYQQILLCLTSWAQQDSPDHRFTPFAFLLQATCTGREPEADARTKTAPFWHVNVISLLVNCTLHNAFSSINFANVPRIK